MPYKGLNVTAHVFDDYNLATRNRKHRRAAANQAACADSIWAKFGRRQ